MSRARQTLPADYALPESRAARRNFDAASAQFNANCVVHDHARQVLLDRLPYLGIEPKVVLDIGCGTGRALAALRSAFPRARVCGLDASAPMLATACDSGGEQQASVLVADAQRLPVASHSVDLIFANLLLPWCDLAAVFAETVRVLAPNGLFMFSSLGPATLQQVRRAWYRVDQAAHVHGFVGPQDVGDLLARAGLYEPVVDVDRIEVTYAAAAALHADLRATGSKNVAGGRRRSLTGARRWRAYEAALEDARHDGRLSITCELVFGQAWAPPVVVTEPQSPAHFKGIPVTISSE